MNFDSLYCIQRNMQQLQKIKATIMWLYFYTKKKFTPRPNL